MAQINFETKDETESDSALIFRTLEIIRQLAKGKFLSHPNLPYPIAMGEDLSIGWLFSEDRVVTPFSFKDLVEWVRLLKIYPIPD